MAQQPYWTGHIRLSLVTFPVRLYNAVTETQKIRLHKYDRRTGQRITTAATFTFANIDERLNRKTLEMNEEFLSTPQKLSGV